MDLQTKEIAKLINLALWDCGETISTAESCTSGSIAAALTSVPGSSKYFKGGIVSYANEVKIEQLGVDANVIAEKTPVCEGVARQMAAGALRMFGTTYAVSSTGFAGPGGVDANAKDSDVKVGTIFVCVSNGTDTEVRRLEGDEGRSRNLENARIAALRLLYDFIVAHKAEGADV